MRAEKCAWFVSYIDGRYLVLRPAKSYALNRTSYGRFTYGVVVSINVDRL